ncbi:enolase-like domain-containing protein [Alterinioella nitratireducens]|uniref:mandelate racemase n=1 Tax=Alterinioella nitratireducens TaxID=2735915 RepID=UPI001551D0E2|nr:mandelate racemase [Alterinioella nitratireducens]NPD18915.1 mandelate racemase [Alterinioella nitratireducens]
MSAARVRIGGARIGLDDVFARMPFRFGSVTIEAAVAATLALELSVDGRKITGYASEILAYKWFDKRPEKSAAQNVADLLSILQDAVARAETFPEGDIFTLWQRLDAEMRGAADGQGHNALMAGYGTSMVERAIIDGVGRALGLTFHQMLKGGTAGLAPGEVFPELADMDAGAALGSPPRDRVAVRHTVGMLDPIDGADLPRDKRLNDGLPETLADYLQDGIRYLKVKIAGDTDADLARLRRISSLMGRTDNTIRLTLDGNEQFASVDAFAGFMEAVRRDPDLEALRRAILFVEQPVERGAALSGHLDPRALDAIGLPLLIDESDDAPDAFRRAIDLGYRGVSHKNCKGVLRSIMNAMLARYHGNLRGVSLFQSAEDLSVLPVAGLNADLAVVAALGIPHVERNAHHFFNGMAHLSPRDVSAGLADHPDLYQPDARVGGRLAIRDGMLSIGSLQRPGMGFPPPDMEARVAPRDWTFDRLERRTN